MGGKLHEYIINCEFIIYSEGVLPGIGETTIINPVNCFIIFDKQKKQGGKLFEVLEVN